MITNIKDNKINNNIYRLIFERLKPAIFVIGESLDIVSANAAALNLSGYDLKQIQPLNLNDLFIVPDNNSNFLLYFNKIGDSGIDDNLICGAILLKQDRTKVKVDLKIQKFSGNGFYITASASDSNNNIKTERSSGAGDGNFKYSLRSSIDALPLWIACGDAEGVYFFANKYYNETFKIPLDKIIGHNFKEIFPHELYLQHKQLYDRCVNTGQSVTFEGKNDFITDRTAFVYGIYTPLISEYNKVYGVSAAIFDNTAKKELEMQIEKTSREIKETKEKYRALVENSICGIAISDDDEIIYASGTLLNIFGYHDLKEFSSKKITEHYTLETQKFIKELKEKKKCGEIIPAEIEIGIIRKDKSVRTLLINIADIKIKDKIYTQTTAIDITERNETNRKLKEWIDRYECITAVSSQIAYEYDIAARIITWWTPVEKILGYKTEEAKNNLDSWIELIHPEDRDKIIKSFIKTETNGRTIDNEYRIKHKDGHFVWIWDRGFFRDNASDITSKKLGLMEDITELKKIEEALISAKEKAEAAGKAKSLFLANISHEIRTPMNGIVGFTNLMGARELNNKQKELNDAIKASCDYLIGLVNDILDFSKIESKNFQIDRDIFEDNTTLHNTTSNEFALEKNNANGFDKKNSNENKSYKILIAEDDAISRLLVKAICDKNGWNIFMARNGVELFEIYKKEKFDIILIDGQMPLMDGFEAAAEIRALEQKSGTRIPIIAITACALKEEQQKFIDAGMDDYISKPIESETLFTQKILSYINKEIQ